MLRLLNEFRAEWFVLAIVSGIGACAVGANDPPNQTLGYSGAAGTSEPGGGSTSNGGSSSGSGGTVPTGGVNHGGFNYGGTPAAGGTPMGGSTTSAGNGGTLGSSGNGGSTAMAGSGGSPAGGSPAGGSPAGGSPAGGSPAGGSPAGGSPAGGSPAGGSNNGGSGGSGPVVVYARDYQFDTDTAPFGLSQYGSTPNIGMAGGPEKLSAKSTLSQTAAYGSPKKGSAQLVIPFTQYGEQLDFNSGFDGARENWTGYTASARIKIISGGNGDATCPLQAWIYITDGNNYTFGAGTTLNLTTTWQDMTYNFATPAQGNPDLTIVNQLGLQIYSNDSGNCAGNPSFSTATIVIDDFQVHKP